jgi:hypothetical protein
LQASPLKSGISHLILYKLGRSTGQHVILSLTRIINAIRLTAEFFYYIEDLIKIYAKFSRLNLDLYFILFRQDLQDLIDFIFYFQFPDETENTQSPAANINLNSTQQLKDHL